MGNKKRKRQAQDAMDAGPPPKKASKQTQTAKSHTIPPTGPFVENPRGADLDREVQLYELLGSEDKNKRLQAAEAIISGLIGGDGVSEQTLQRHLERRLFRGLASGRKASRLGFSIAITELLSSLLGSSGSLKDKYPSLDFDKLLQTLLEKNTPKGDLSGQEERDHFFGRLFGIQCFVRAKIIFNDAEQAGHRWKSAFKSLTDLANKKIWLREECGFIINESLAQMTQVQAEWTLKEFHKEGLSLTPEGVGIWITAKRLFPAIELPTKPWGHNKTPLDNLPLLASTLKQTSKVTEGEAPVKTSGNWSAQLHFVWSIVLDELCKGLFAKHSEWGSRTTLLGQDEENFIQFWKITVDENLFSASASPERKYWGFQLFQKMLNDIKSCNDEHPNDDSHDVAFTCNRLLPYVFSPNFFKCLINHSAQEDRFLHKAAQKSLKTIQDVTSSSPRMGSKILAILLSKTFNFDQATKSKTIDTILAHLDGFAAYDAFKILTDEVRSFVQNSNPKDLEPYLQKCGEYLLSMIRHANLADTAKDYNFIYDALYWLAASAYCRGKYDVSERFRSNLRTRFSSAVAHIISDPKACQFPSEVLLKFVPDAIEMDEQVTATRNKAYKTMEKLNTMSKSRKERGNDKSVITALSILYALVLIQLYNGEAEAISLFDELDVCYNKLIGDKHAISSEVDTTQVLVEIILSLVSKPSTLLRKAAGMVFSAFSVTLTDKSLKLMTDILESSESLKGQQELFDQEGDDEEMLNDNGIEENDLDSDVEIVDIDDRDDADEANEDSNEESDDEEEHDDGDDEDADEVDEAEAEEHQKLDDALAKALGTHRADQDLDAESSDSDADMTDSEMMALDSKLTEIFKQRTEKSSKNKDKQDAKVNIVNFKNRVLDLLEIYVKREPDSPLAFRLLSSLLRLMRTTNTPQLRERANEVIRAFSKATRDARKRPDIYKEETAKKHGKHQKEDGINDGDEPQDEPDKTPDFAPDASGRLVRVHPTAKDIDVSDLMLEILKEIHSEALLDDSHQFAAVASAACSLVLTNMFRMDMVDVDRDYFGEVATVYRDSLVAWFQNGMRLQASFFHDFLNWCSVQKGNAASMPFSLGVITGLSTK